MSSTIWDSVEALENSCFSTNIYIYIYGSVFGDDANFSYETISLPCIGSSNIVIRALCFVFDSYLVQFLVLLLRRRFLSFAVIYIKVNI